MIISFAPLGVVDGHDWAIRVQGDTIFIDGEEYDFSPIDLGDRLPTGACTPNPFLEQGFITRGVNGIELTIRLPHAPSAPYERRFMDPIIVTEDGDINLPPYDSVQDEPTLPEPQSDEDQTNEVVNGND
ncbi:hypothetical protein [Pseudomonas mosselii]|uniref:hypothetical protein n=1 Tax=Pseudomonas mosselii TaxID=78327 RepID=UPI003F3EBD04